MTPGAPPSGPYDTLFAALYPRLRRLAHGQLRRNEPITLLDTTGLVHELWLRLAGKPGMPLHDPGMFLGYAARVMRFVVIDFVRRRHAERRGGDQLQVTLDTGIAESATLHDEQLLRLNDAIDALGAVDERLVQVIEMRCFGGLSEEQMAEAMGVTTRTVRRHWQRARLLLHAALS